jgi:crotonobetainyl-CoA:carnitine CoA-transferase CaiB-like acyl-CoA transferase
MQPAQGFCERSSFARANREPRYGSALDDAVVLEIASGHGSATVASKVMADLGCTVFKIESEYGDPLREQSTTGGVSLFTLLNGNKSSVALNERHPHARDVSNALCSRATAVIVDQDGWRRLSAILGGDAHAIHPHLTICHCTPFGVTGKWANWVGGEDIVQALSGVMSTTGHPDSGPMRISGAMLTHSSALFAATAVIADLVGKRVGQGRRIDAAMIDAAITFLTAALPYYALNKTPPLGIGNRHTMAAPWNSFRCSDGWLILCAGNDPTWLRLCQAIGRTDFLSNPDYATQENRIEHIEALEAEITAWTQQRSVDEAEQLLDRAGVPCGSIASPERVLTHPQFAARAMLRNLDGDHVLGGLFFRNGEPLPIEHGKTELGEGNEDALAISGVAPDIIARWRGSGVLCNIAHFGKAHVPAA